MKIVLDIEKTKLGYLIGCDKLSIYENGDTIHETLQNFIDEFEGFRKYYNNLKWEETTGLATTLKKFYEELKD